ncbi:hypothetical protein APR12_003791 [Nocardia amikacinitolerans]|nr:hypothetical protein [Nocardia amikacinitolerans]
MEKFAACATARSRISASRSRADTLNRLPMSAGSQGNAGQLAFVPRVTVTV